MRRAHAIYIGSLLVSAALFALAVQIRPGIDEQSVTLDLFRFVLIGVAAIAGVTSWGAAIFSVTVHHAAWPIAVSLATLAGAAAGLFTWR